MKQAQKSFGSNIYSPEQGEWFEGERQAQAELAEQKLVVDRALAPVAGLAAALSGAAVAEPAVALGEVLTAVQFCLDLVYVVSGRVPGDFFR